MKKKKGMARGGTKMMKKKNIRYARGGAARRR